MATTYRFKKIDAFATPNSSGNPAGMVYLEPGEDISDSDMQKIAIELKGFVSEVAYVRQLDEERFSLRYFSSEREVEFCGHATVAAMYDLLTNREDLKDKATLTLQVNAGEITLWNHLEKEGAIYISAPPPHFRKTSVDPEKVARALGCSPDTLASRPSLQIANVGLETLLTPINSLEGILGLWPDYDTLKAYCEEIGVDTVTVYTEEVADNANRYRTRVFCPTFGYLEDPASGSGNGALCHYLLKLGLWQGEVISFEQNGSQDRPNIIKLKGELGQTERPQVIFGGGAITRISGVYHLV